MPAQRSKWDDFDPDAESDEEEDAIGSTKEIVTWEVIVPLMKVRKSPEVNADIVAYKKQGLLVPCDASKAEQAWGFGKGIHSPSSMYSVQSNQALAVDDSTLFSAPHQYKGGKDAYPVPSTAYGATILKMVGRAEQKGCGRRGCENYDDTQMWFWDPVESPPVRGPPTPANRPPAPRIRQSQSLRDTR